MTKENGIKFLFNGKYVPLTNGMAFIDAPIDDILKGYFTWMEEMLECKKRIIHEHKNGFEELLNKSLPFIYPKKDVFFETKGNWTGFFTNSREIVFAPARVVSKYINVSRFICTIARPSSFRKIINGWGGGAFYFYKENKLIREIMLSDQDRWELDNYGEPFPFEDTEKYKEKFARNRFTPEMLDKYLKEFGIDFFNEDFYMPEGCKAYILEHVRPPFENEKAISLEDMRKEYMYD